MHSAGKWDVVLTPTKPVPKDWFGPLEGKKILGLASGGGQQMPIFTALGAQCTVLDYSPKQLESETLVAQREGYAIETVRASMTEPLPFADASFDLIFHPVSNCYIEDVLPVWKECFRVLRPGGRLLAGMDNGINYLVDDTERHIIHSLPFNPLRDPALLEEPAKKATAGSNFPTRSRNSSADSFRRGSGFWICTRTPTAKAICTTGGSPPFGRPLAQKPLP